MKKWMIMLGIASLAIAVTFLIAYAMKYSYELHMETEVKKQAQEKKVQDLQKQVLNLEKDTQDLVATNKILEKHVNQVRFHEELVNISFYSDENDYKPTSRNFGWTFTGARTAGGVIAIDPVAWSKKMGLDYDPKWSQEKRARADIFWKTIFVNRDTNKVFLPRDVGGGIKGIARVDVWIPKEQFDRYRPLLGETLYQKFMAICFAP